MARLYRSTDNTLLGEITEAQLQFLVDQMEEESLEDQDYAITPIELAFFEGQGADSTLLELLRRALGDQDEVIIRWSR